MHPRDNSTKKGLKVLFVTHELPPLGGGGSTVAYYLARKLAQLDCEILVLTSHFKGLPKHEVVDGAEIFRIPVFRRRKINPSLPELVAYVLIATIYSFKLVKRHNVQLVHSIFGIPSGIIAFVVKKLIGTPYLVYLGGADIPGISQSRHRRLAIWLTPLIKIIWRKAAAVVVNEGLDQAVHLIDAGLKVESIPSGVDTRYLKPASQRPHDKVKILSVGRLIKRKGFQYIIQALPMVLQNATKEVEVEIVGDGPFRRELETQVRYTGVMNNVIFSGQISYEMLIEKYQKADIFILVVTPEGTPCVVVEAMSCGLPIITTDIPGSQMLVEEGKNGILVPLGDVQALARAITTLVNNQSLRKEMGNAGRLVAQKFDWGMLAPRYLRIYKSLLNNQRTS